ncbi:MAG: glycosyltransferase family 4 protein [Amphiplicatus sp.]
MAGERAIGLLHIFPSFARGGQQMRLAALAEAFQDEFRHHVVSLDGDISARSAFAEDSISIEAFRARKSRLVSLANVNALRRVIADAGADMLCTYNFGALEAAIANRLWARLPHIHYEDGFGADEARRQKRRRALLRRLVLRDSFVVVPSQKLADIALMSWRLSPARLRLITNGVDVAKFRAAPRRPVDETVIVGAVGGLRPEKNVGRLIRAFAALPADAKAKLVIFGDGPERARLEALVRKSGAAVEFRGATTQPEKAYASIDIFALSSDTEQAPLSLMEAMAAGLPIVTTQAGDIRSMLAPINTEFATPLGDERAFEMALRRLVQSENLRARLGAANAEKAAAAFGLEGMAAAHRALFEEALARDAA